MGQFGLEGLRYSRSSAGWRETGVGAAQSGKRSARSTRQAAMQGGIHRLQVPCAAALAASFSRALIKLTRKGELDGVDRAGRGDLGVEAVEFA